MADFNFTEKTNPATADFVVGYDAALGNVANSERKIALNNLPVSAAVTTALGGKANTSHTHTVSQVTDAGTAATKNVAASGDASATEVVKGDDTRLTNARTPTSHTHPQSEITNLTTDLAAKVSKSLYDANTILKADTDDTPVALTVGTNTVVGRINGGITTLAVDSDLTSVSAGDDSVPSAKATKTALDLKSPIDSPTFTGTPTAPTATQGNNSTQLATTAYVDTGLGSKLSNQSAFRDCDVLCPTSSSVFSGLKFWQVSEIFKTFDNGAIDAKFTSYDSGDGWRFKVSDGNGIIYSLNIDGNHNKYSTGNLRVGTLNVALTSAGVIIGGDNFTGEIGSVGSGTSVIHRSKLYLRKPSDATDTYVFRCGLISQVSKEQPICGVWLEYNKDVNSGNWVLYSKNGGSVSSTNTSIAPRFKASFDCDYYQEIEVFLTSSAAVARFRDFGNSGPGTWSSDFSVTTNLPLTGGYGTGHGCGGAVIASTASTATKEFYIDYLFYRRVQE